MITTDAQKRVVADAIKRSLERRPHPDGPFGAAVELLVLPVAEWSARLLPHVQRIHDDRVRGQDGLSEARSREDVRVGDDVRAAEDTIANLRNGGVSNGLVEKA